LKAAWKVDVKVLPKVAQLVDLKGSQKVDTMAALWVTKMVVWWVVAKVEH